MTSVLIPIRTARGLNNREHPMARHKRVKREREAVAWLFPRALRGAATKHTPERPIVVELIRMSAGTLDDDNLQGALKSVRDEAAKQLGVDDRDPRIRWAYGQVIARATRQGVEIKFYSSPTEAQEVKP